MEGHWEQQQEAFFQAMRESKALRAAMLMYFQGMSEVDAISLARHEDKVLDERFPGEKIYDDEGHIIENLNYPELKLPSLGDKPVHVRELIEASKRDLLSRGVISDDLDEF